MVFIKNLKKMYIDLPLHSYPNGRWEYMVVFAVALLGAAVSFHLERSDPPGWDGATEHSGFLYVKSTKTRLSRNVAALVNEKDSVPAAPSYIQCDYGLFIEACNISARIESINHQPAKMWLSRRGTLLQLDVGGRTIVNASHVRGLFYTYQPAGLALSRVAIALVLIVLIVNYLRYQNR